jgi:hypothetical protein
MIGCCGMETSLKDSGKQRSSQLNGPHDGGSGLPRALVAT